MKVQINNPSTEQEFVNLHILQQKKNPYYKAFPGISENWFSQLKIHMNKCHSIYKPVPIFENAPSPNV